VTEQDKGSEAAEPSRALRLLLVDDNPRDRELTVRALRLHFAALTVHEALDQAQFDRLLRQQPLDAAVIDYQIHWSDGLELLRLIKCAHPDCPVIMFTASGTEELAVEAMKAGLDDYVTKTVNHYARLPFALDACLARVRHQRALEQALAERQALALQAHASEQRLQLALEAAGMVAWEHELGTDRLTLSPAGSRLLGCPGTTGTEAMTALFGEDSATIRGRYERSIAGGQPFHCELRASGAAGKSAGPDGRGSWIEISAQPQFDERGAVRSVLGVAGDITERKHAEEALRHADQRKDRFLATLAHELRNPLAPIRYATRLLDPTVPAQMAADARQMIDRQLAHMSRLLDDLLDVSRVSRGRLELRRELLDLRTLIETAVRDARPAALAGRRTLTVRLPYEPLPVLGDSNRLTQVLGNLLSNAIKYTEPGGHIAVEADGAGPEIRISVRDDGIGIPAELLPQIFELFVQAEPRSAHASDGLGIGLSLARELVELHEGVLEASSPGPGRGSQFTVRLPRQIEKPAVSAAPSVAENVVALGAADVRLLVIDDNRDSADTLCSLLSLAGYDTRVAYEGNAALHIAEEFHPAIVLLDIGLPDKSGHEVARLLRSLPWATHLRLIAISGWGQDADRERSREAGIDEHLTKPVDPRLLLQLVMRLTRAEPGADTDSAARSLHS